MRCVIANAVKTLAERYDPSAADPPLEARIRLVAGDEAHDVVVDAAGARVVDGRRRAPDALISGPPDAWRRAADEPAAARLAAPRRAADAPQPARRASASWPRRRRRGGRAPAPARRTRPRTARSPPPRPAAARRCWRPRARRHARPRSCRRSARWPTLPRDRGRPPRLRRLRQAAAGAVRRAATSRRVMAAVLDAAGDRPRARRRQQHGRPDRHRDGADEPERVDRLVLLSPAMAWLRPRRWAPVVRLLRPELSMLPLPVEPLVRRLVPARRLGRRRHRRVPARLHDAARAPRLQRRARNIYLDEPHGDDGLWSRLAGMQHESLFVWGRKDTLVPIGFMKHVERTFPAARHVELDCGHVPQVERPRETHDAMRAFLSRSDAAARQARRHERRRDPCARAIEGALYELKRVIVGQDAMLERLLVALLAGGHVLLEGVPGLAKTLTVKTLADVLGGSFRRVQFTPDLVPADLVGTRIYRPDTGRFDTELGPVFGNFLLADEINRAPAKVQSALLEVMQERQVTIGGETYPAAAAVPRDGDAEPDRVRGHVPAARGAGRPLPVQAARRLPAVGEEAAVVGRAIGAGAGGARAAADRGARALPASSRGASYVDRDVIGYAVALADATRHPGKYGLHRARRPDRVRRQPARADRPGPGRPGAGAAARPQPRGRRGRRRPRARTCCATGSCSPTTRSATASRPTTCSTASSTRGRRAGRSRSRLSGSELRPRVERSPRAAWRPCDALAEPPGRQGPGPMQARWSRRSTSCSRAARRRAAGRAPAPGAGRRHRARADPPVPVRRRRPPDRRRGHRPHRRPARAAHVPERTLTTWLLVDVSPRWRSAPPTG